MKVKDILGSKVLLESISHNKVNVALRTIIAYLEKHTGHKFVKVPGHEHFVNKKSTGYGVSYVIKGTLDIIRFNWKTNDKFTSTAGLFSVDLFLGNARQKTGPNYTIETQGVPLVKAIQKLPAIILDPHENVYDVYEPVPTDFIEILHESFELIKGTMKDILTEAKANDFTDASCLRDLLSKLKDGKQMVRSEFVSIYHINKLGIFDELQKSEYSHIIKMNGKRMTLHDLNHDLEDMIRQISHKTPKLIVTKGGNNEKIIPTDDEKKLEVEFTEKLSFKDVISNIKTLTQALAKGAGNSLIISGAGGLGKTHNVEEALNEIGLEDGNGYTKITGSSSAIGVYLALYRARNSIILFDDCDTALLDQESRNLFKAATDTKKIRKMVWNKKSMYVWDNNEDGSGVPNIDVNDPEFRDNPEMAPNIFNFRGRVIVISNMSLNKLDPDGAFRTRSYIIDVNPTKEEVISFLEEILDEIKLEEGLTLDSATRKKVLEIVRSSSNKEALSIRRLVKGLNLAATGVSNWERIVKYHA